MKTSPFEVSTKQLIKELKSLGIIIGCYSWRINDRPSGRATEDCEFAIDIHTDKELSRLSLDYISEKDPYKNGSNITRLKFGTDKLTSN